MKSSFLPLACLVGAALSTGCQTPPPANARGRTVVISETNAGKPFQVAVGDTLVVQLAANPTTGYSWQNKQAVGSSLVPTGKQPEYVPDKVSPGVVGAGGYNFFRYEVKGAGTERLLYVYLRPWAPLQPARQVEFQIDAHHE